MYATNLHEEDAPGLDHHVVLRSATWRDFERVLRMRGDRGGLRVYYLDGEIELMSPSRAHEKRKSKLAALLETWLAESRPDYDAVGSWTLKKEIERAGAEPDECYLFDDFEKDIPDLAIEVEHSRGLLAKHAIYERLGVRELWTLRRDGKLVIRVLTKGKYVERAKSAVLPRLDPKLLLRFLDIEPQGRAVRALQQALRIERKRR